MNHAGKVFRSHFDCGFQSLHSHCWPRPRWSKLRLGGNILVLRSRKTPATSAVDAGKPGWVGHRDELRCAHKSA